MLSHIHDNLKNYGNISNDNGNARIMDKNKNTYM